MNIIKRVAWLREKMSKINKNGGIANGTLTSLQLDQILNYPLKDFSSPVAPEDAILATRVRESAGKPIAEVISSDIRFLDRTIDKRFRAVDRILLIDEIKKLPRRKLDGSAHGFLINIEKDEANAHVTMFFVDAENNVLFLDAIRVAQPETFISEIPPLGFQRQVYFSQSTPPEGLRLGVTTDDEASAGDLLSLGISPPPITEAFKRERRATEVMIGDMGAASKTRYGYVRASLTERILQDSDDETEEEVVEVDRNAKRPRNRR